MREFKLCHYISVYDSAYYALQCVIEELEGMIRHYDFNLNKYTIDGKRLYSESQGDHVKEVRKLKAATLLSLRQAQKALRAIRCK